MLVSFWRFRDGDSRNLLRHGQRKSHYFSLNDHDRSLSLAVARLRAPVNSLRAPPLAHYRRFFTPISVVFTTREVYSLIFVRPCGFNTVYSSNIDLARRLIDWPAPGAQRDWTSLGIQVRWVWFSSTTRDIFAKHYEAWSMWKSARMGKEHILHHFSDGPT